MHWTSTKARKHHPNWMLALLFVLTLSLPGCELVGSIFKVGVWAGIIMVAVVVLLVAFVVRLVTGPRRV